MPQPDGKNLRRIRLNPAYPSVPPRMSQKPLPLPIIAAGGVALWGALLWLLF
jgi:hypothetical protein